MTMIHISGKTYEVIHENRSGWNAEAFRDRYSDVLERYDFIVGDWGYSQLRLKGFYRDHHQKATKDSNLSAIPDYINEYCNFGCAYFVLGKTHSSKQAPSDEDYDLEEDELKLTASDIRAAAASSQSNGLETAEEDDEAVSQAQESHPYTSAKERNYRSGRKDNRSNNRHGHHNTNTHRASDKGNSGDDSRNHEGERGSRGKKDLHSRKARNHDNRNHDRHDNRGKKQIRLADHEAAAASAMNPRGGNKKD